MSLPHLPSVGRLTSGAVVLTGWAAEDDDSGPSEHVWAGRAGTRLKRTAVGGVVLLALLNAADAVTTHLVLAATPVGATEANPLAQILISGGTPRLLLTKMAIIALLGMSILRRRPRLGITVGVWLTCGLYVAAVLSNILILRML
jgi:hypothetical protein